MNDGKLEEALNKFKALSEEGYLDSADRVLQVQERIRENAYNHAVTLYENEEFENAIIKARHASKISGKPAIADDSGICVPVLGGAPGIYSARYAGEHGNDAANNEKLLADLKPLRQEGETIEGMFVCVLALVQHAEDPLPQVFQGIWHGEILEAARGENGFGYDPLFWLPELGISSAEMSKEEKNKISHRGQAMQLFKASLAK